jgi:hypothetical protein
LGVAAAADRFPVEGSEVCFGGDDGVLGAGLAAVTGVCTFHGVST